MSEDPMSTAPAAPAVSAAGIERMFQEHHGMVFRAAYRVTGNAGDAEDALQTVFLRLLRRSPEADTLESPESYLRRAAINAALDIMRARQSAQAVPLEELEPVLARPADAADRAAAAGEIRAWLRKTVARLSPRAAEMFALRFYEGLANGEIARILGTTEGTVAVMLSRARDRVFKEYQAITGGKP